MTLYLLAALTDDEKYCYTHGSCSGAKASRHGGGVMSFKDCCSGQGAAANGWGIYDGDCTACVEGGHGNKDDQTVLHHLDEPHGQSVSSEINS